MRPAWASASRYAAGWSAIWGAVWRSITPGRMGPVSCYHCQVRSAAKLAGKTVDGETIIHFVDRQILLADLFRGWFSVGVQDLKGAGEEFGL